MIIHQIRYTPQAGWNAPLPIGLDSERTLALVFAAPRYGECSEPLGGLLRAFPRSCKLGCSTAGEIHGTEVLDDSIAMTLVRFERDISLRAAHAPIGKTNSSRAAGEQLAVLLDRPQLRAILVLSEGIEVNGSDLILGLRSRLPRDVVVVGGLAGDTTRFARTWVVCDGRVASGNVCAVGLYGSHLRIGHGSGGGWNIFGVERRVTRSEGNVLYELDGRPALALYKEYLGERAAELPSSALLFPLALRSSAVDTRLIVRTILGVSEQDQSLNFAGDIPQGSLAQLMRTNIDNLIQGAETAAFQASAGVAAETPVLSIAVSCVGRRLALGQRTDEETEATMQAMPKGSVQAGFYSYGEISTAEGGFCDLHNQTMTITTLWEA